jgi:transcription elongation factor Elf1
MRIKNIIEQVRRDFSALMVCEFCGHEQKLSSGYDDRYYHDNVIPGIDCKSCGKSTNSGGGKVQHRSTKYSDNETV